MPKAGFQSAVIGSLLLAAVSNADIYKYRDTNGGVLLTDKPRKESIFTLEKTFHFKRYANPRSGGQVASYKGLKDRVRQWEPLVEEVSAYTGVDKNLLHAVILAESAYDPKAISSAGARGMMQLMPATAERFEVEDSYDPRQNMIGGATYLRQLLALFDQDLDLALAAYNAGEGAVAKYGGIPPYPETQDYVRKVKEFHREGMGTLLN